MLKRSNWSQDKAAASVDPAAVKSIVNGATAVAPRPAAAPAPSRTQHGVLIVGAGTKLSGEIAHCVTAEIQGEFDGKLRADTLIVCDGGKVTGECWADKAEVHGRLEGKLAVAGLLDVRSQGVVSGQVSYESLSVASGGSISGELVLVDPAKDKPKKDAKSETRVPFAGPVAAAANGASAPAKPAPAASDASARPAASA